MAGTEQKTEHEEDLGSKSTVQEEKEMHEDDVKLQPEENTGDSKAIAGEAPSEEAENTSLHPASGNKTEDKSSEIQQHAAAKDGTQTHEEGREAEGSEGEESSTPTPNEKAENETAMEDNAGAAATTAEETIEMKMELSEGQEALSSVEAPVADAEERPWEDGEDGPTGPNTELSIGNGRNVLEESGGTEMSRDAPNTERDDKEETAGEEETEQSVQTPDELEEKSEGKDEEKQTEPEIGEIYSSEERREEEAEAKPNASVGADGTTDQSLKTNEGEDSTCVKDGDEEDETEATGVGETMSDTCGEVKKDETDAEQKEAGQINTGNQEKEEGGSPSAGELEKNTDADSAEEKKNPEGSFVEPDNELANIEVEETVREASGEEKEKGDIDAETASKAESLAQRDAEEAETAAHRCDEIKPEEEEGAVAKESTAESLNNEDKGGQLHPSPDAGSGDGPGPETELEESCNVPQQDDEILTKEVLAEVTAEQSSTPVLLTATAPTFDISDAMPESEEHPLSAITDLTAVRGESGETEPSRASEEGASVVPNPQASFPDQEECRAANPEITEIVNTEENVDLVSNWVITHQVAKFFETFVEPLDDLKETQAGVTQHDQSAEPMSPVKPVKVVENEEQEQSKEEATELQQESNIVKTSTTCEKEPEAGEQEATEVGGLRLGYEPGDEELTKGLPAGSEGNRTSLQQVKDQEGFMENNAEQDRVSTPGVKDKAESHDSATRGSAEHQSEQEDPDLKGKPTPVEEYRDQQAETEHHSQRSSRAEEPENAEEICEVKEKTVAAELTWEKRPGEAEERAPELPDTTDVELIQDLRHSKDRLSVSSLNETHFGRSSYPLLAAVRTQNGQ